MTIAQTPPANLSYILYHTGGEDYYPPVNGLLLELGSHSQCTSIPIVDDVILEHTELFGFSLHLPPGSNERVQLQGAGHVTEVTILDNDGMEKFCRNPI